MQQSEILAKKVSVQREVAELEKQLHDYTGGCTKEYSLKMTEIMQQIIDRNHIIISLNEQISEGKNDKVSDPVEVFLIICFILSLISIIAGL